MINLCVLCTTMLKSFRSLRKLFRRWLPFSYECLGLFSRQDAKNAKFGFIFSFAAFAPLREIFRVLVAAQTRWASAVNHLIVHFESQLISASPRRSAGETRSSSHLWAA